MRKQTILYLTIGLLIMVLVGTACGSSQGSVQTLEPQPPAAIENPPQGAQETEPDGGETAPGTETVHSESEVPEDIPIPEGVYELDVARKGAYIQYKWDGEIADLVEFYQQEFPNTDWKDGNSPDTSLGSMAALLREKESGERVTISMQSNQLGGFVVVTISISRD